MTDHEIFELALKHGACVPNDEFEFDPMHLLRFARAIEDSEHRSMTLLFAMDALENDGWLPMREAPKSSGPVLLLVPTLSAKRSTHLQSQGEWLGSYWAIFNGDEAVQRVEPVGWRPLHKCPAGKVRT